MSKEKIFVLDTNILLTSPNAIFGFGDNTVVITGTTIEELDSKKRDGSNGEIRHNARESARILDELRMKGDLTVGVPLDNGGMFKVELWDDESNKLPKDYNLKQHDNQIINICVNLKEKHNQPVILVTNDAFMRIKASLCDVKVEKYRNDRIESEEFYTGRRVLDVSSDIINSLYRDKSIDVNMLNKYIENNFIEREFVTLKAAGNQSALCNYSDGKLHVLKKIERVFGVTPRNAAQTFFLSALLAPADEIPMVIGLGPAGCVDNETEFFNGKEWKTINTWNKNDKVLQFDINTNVATLVTPNAYIKIPCDEMIHFETKYGINQTLSLDHNVIAYGYSKTTKGYTNIKEFLAKDFVELYKNGHPELRFKTDFIYSGCGIDLSDSEIKIMCAVICDGTFNKNNPDSKRCTLNLKKERKCKQIEELFDVTNTVYNKTKMTNGYTRYMFDAPRREKEFSSFWYDCTQHQLQIVCDNILQWDGSETNGRKTFTQANKTTVDFLQFAFSACGYRAAISISKEKGEIKTLDDKEYKRKNDLYRMTISKRTMVGLSSDRREDHVQTQFERVKPTDGYKYCFNVPTHALVLRRKGRIFITGNCAKTFLSLAAGLDQTYDSRSNRNYDKILITRSNTMADADFGYLPGELEEKMLPLLAPFFDNLESLLRGSSGEDSSQVQMQIEDLLETKVIDICPMAYMRGRSITNSYLIVDEAQNATKSQIRDIITRAGKGTKVILLGDPEQIDNHLLDRWNNGLVFAAEKMKGSPLCAQITFTDNESVRSELATEAIKRLEL